MSRKFRELTEAQIRKAIAEGKLKNLAGEGRPLPAHPENALIDPGTAIGHRIMAEAGAIPEEIRIKRLVQTARDRLAQVTDPAARKAAMAELADLEMKLAIAQEARRKFLK